MNSNIRIILGGPAGSGKTTIGKLLAENLGVEFYSMGNKSREKAKRLGLTLLDYQIYLDFNPDIEIQNDEEFCSEMRNKNGFVLDYRMGFHFLEQAMCIYLDINSEIAAYRVKNRVSIEECFIDKSQAQIEQELNIRNKALRERYIKLYGVDCLNKENFGHYILTDEMQIEEIVSEILQVTIKNIQNPNFQK